MRLDNELHPKDDHEQQHEHHRIGVLSNNDSEGGGDRCDYDPSVPKHLFESNSLTLDSRHSTNQQHLGLEPEDNPKKLEKTSPRRPPLSSNSSTDNLRATSTNSNSSMSP